MSPAPHLPPEDADRDAWLREALRHAPDADLAAPPALSEAILHEARSKARRPAAAAPLPAWPRFWAWLARPVVGTSLAGVMLASLIGVMWRDRPPAEISSRVLVEAVPAAAPAATPAPYAAPEPARDASAAPVQDSVVHDAPRNAATPAARQKAAERRKQDEKAVAPPAPQAADALAKAGPQEPPPPAAPAVAAAPQAAAEAGATQAPEVAGALGARARSQPGRAPMASAGATREHRLARAESAASPLAGLRQALAADPARWTWQAHGETPRGIDPALHAFLDEVDAVTGNRWKVASPRADDTGGGRDALHLLHEGRVAHSFRLGDAGTLRWQRTAADAGQAAERGFEVGLDGAQAQRLRHALERLGR